MEIDNERRVPGRPRREAAELRSEIRSEGIRGKTRKRKGGQVADRFYVNPDSIPNGMSYEWKTVTVYGKEDPSYNVFLREQGWDPVMADRHHELVAEGATGPIIRDGLMLMERPIELTREAQDEDRAAARDVIQTKKQQMGEAPTGHFERQSPVINTRYEAMPIDG